MSSDLKQRLIGILYLLPFVLGVLAGAPFMNIVIGILQALLCYEFARLLTKNTLHIALYALYFSEKYWPDFTCADLDEAIDNFANRQRRFGGDVIEDVQSRKA